MGLEISPHYSDVFTWITRTHRVWAAILIKKPLCPIRNALVNNATPYWLTIYFWKTPLASSGITIALGSLPARTSFTRYTANS